MKAIEVRYLGPTNFKGSRVKATAEGGHALTESYDSSLSHDEAFDRVAAKLAARLGWEGFWIRGGLVRGGHVYVVTRASVEFSDADTEVAFKVVVDPGERESRESIGLALMVSHDGGKTGWTLDALKVEQRAFEKTQRHGFSPESE